ncbi:MAG: dimethylarginine dimethylaminohydrolase family protein [Chitinophagales bacterium]
MVNNLGQYHEWDRLTSIIVGSALDSGQPPREQDCYDPTTLATVKRGIYPKQELLGQQLEALAKTLESLSVKVYRPKNLPQVDQIFARDVGFVIQDVLVRSKMIEDRAMEWEGVKDLLQGVKSVTPPSDVLIEGGDVLISGNKLYVGYSDEATISSLKTARTNEKSLLWLQKIFPDIQVVGVQLIKDDLDLTKNVLHLDCAFMPLGLGHCIVYKEGFRTEDDYHKITEDYPMENIFHVNQEEAILLATNLLSIDRHCIVSDKRFTRVNKWLESNGYDIHLVDYSAIGKLGGLLRCSTLPLERQLV